MNNTRLYLNLRNISEICRVCLLRKERLTSLLRNIEVKIDNVKVESAISIVEAINQIVSVSVEILPDNLPSNICLECKHLLEAAYKFKLTYEQSSTILNTFLSSDNTVKVDDIEDCNENNIEFKIDNDVIDQQVIRASKTDLEEHASSEPLPKTIPCPICPIELSALDLRQHVHTHKALKKYLNIPKIKKDAIFIANARNTESIFNKSQVKHKCPFCNEEFNVAEFRLHVDNHRRHDEFKCNQCDRVFGKINHLNTHKIKHLKEFPYKCNTCGKGFVIKKNYDCHMLTHADVELPHTCDFCGKRFSNPEHLHRHLIIHTENVTYSLKYKVVRCRRCLKSFRDSDQIKNHSCEPVKLINSKHPCKICSKMFTTSSSLYNHVRMYHKNGKSRDLCTVCGVYVSNLYVHMMRHTGEKPYKCNQCIKKFSSKPVLRQHLLVHSGVKPFVCSVCAKAFNNLYNLQVHERIHVGNRCHICAVCNKGFLEKSYLRKHMNVHKKV